MATFQQRSGKWLARVRKAGFPPQSKTFSSKRMAQAWAMQLEYGFQRGIAGLPDKTTNLGDLLMRYQKTVTPHKKSHKDEARRINWLLKHPISTLSLIHLTPAVISSFRDERLKDGVRTTQCDLTLMRHCVETARREWGIFLSDNPFDAVKKPKPNKGRERRLGAGEYETLMRALGGSQVTYLKPIIDLALGTALRQSEILQLKWENICLDGRLIRVVDTKNGFNRSIPMMINVHNIFNEIKSNNKLVFEVNGSPLRQSWTRLVKRAGIEDLHFHDLRHEAISRFFEMGLTPPEVASISGHRTLAQLMRYSHANTSLVADKLRSIDPDQGFYC